MTNGALSFILALAATSATDADSSDRAQPVAVAQAQVQILHLPSIEPEFVRGEIRSANQQREVADDGRITILFQ
jgi:hypothetical protein